MRSKGKYGRESVFKWRGGKERKTVERERKGDKRGGKIKGEEDRV